MFVRTRVFLSTLLVIACALFFHQAVFAAKPTANNNQFVAACLKNDVAAVS